MTHTQINAPASAIAPTPTNTESISMTTSSTTAISTPAPTGFDLNAMRLPPNYGATLGVKKVFTTIPVNKPDKTKFFKVLTGEEWVFGAYILQLKEVNETYLVSPHIAPILGGLARPAQLHAAIDRHNNVFLIPVFLPGEDGKRNQWHESLAQAVNLAETHWVRVVANMSVGGYDVLQAQGALAEPVWPDTSMEELVNVAFRCKIIDTENHPVIHGLLGAV